MQSQKMIRKRKMAMALPLLAFPFLTLAFWALGGGSAPGNEMPVHHGGLDLTLPAPKLNNRLEDKLSLYDQAERRARKLKEAKAADPYSEIQDTLLSSFDEDSGNLPEDNPLSGSDDYSGLVMQKSDPTEAELRQQLAALKKQLNDQPGLQPDTDMDFSEADFSVGGSSASFPGMAQPTSFLPDAAMPATGTTADPELQQLDNMLTKILDIEHPQRVKDRLQRQSMEKQGLVFPVKTKPHIAKADLLQPGNNNVTELPGNGFYESGNDFSSQNETAIPAVVHETQTLISGATLKLRLTEAVFINGLQIPKGTFVFGICNLDGERLTITIKHVRFKNALLPVNLSVYDMDGIEGIRIPGAISRDAAKQGITNGIQSMDFYNMDPSVGAQAASAGIQTFKSLLGNKAKLIKATVRAGYPVLLVDNNKRHQ